MQTSIYDDELPYEVGSSSFGYQIPIFKGDQEPRAQVKDIYEGNFQDDYAGDGCAEEDRIIDFLKVRPVKFQFPHVLYSSERYGYKCTFFAPTPGRRLESVISELLGEEGWKTKAERAECRRLNIDKVRTICETVALQV